MVEQGNRPAEVWLPVSSAINHNRPVGPSRHKLDFTNDHIQTPLSKTPQDVEDVRQRKDGVVATRRRRFGGHHRGRNREQTVKSRQFRNSLVKVGRLLYILPFALHLQHDLKQKKTMFMFQRLEDLGERSDSRTERVWNASQTHFHLSFNTFSEYFRPPSANPMISVESPGSNCG
jgi:hypothetical protein